MKLEERRRVHALQPDQLAGELAEVEKTLLNFRFDAGLKRLTNPSGMHNARKRIALLKMLIREHELLAESGFTSMDEYRVHRAAERKAFRANRKAS